MIDNKNNSPYIKSSPYFFKIISISMAVVVVSLILLAALFDAPLQEPAEPYHVPNPSKSAWFLLWTQELVSYHVYFIYLIVGIFIFFLFLPFIYKKTDPSPTAAWFQSRFSVATIISIVVFLSIIALTVIAYFFRGEYWRFTL